MSKRKIPRGIKKDISKSLKDIKKSNQSSVSKKSVDKKGLKAVASEMIADGDRSQKVFNWNFKVGDLVLVNSDKINGIVIKVEEVGEGYTMKAINQHFQISTARGQYWVGGKNLRIIQKSCKS